VSFSFFTGIDPDLFIGLCAMAAKGVEAGVLAKLDELSQRYARMEDQLGDPDVLGDHAKVREISIGKAAIEPVVLGYRRYMAMRREAEDLRGVVASGADPELAELAEAELESLDERSSALLEEVKAALVTSDDRAVGSVILEIRAGTGGDEAGLWARDLLDVYRKYADIRGWTFELLELSEDGGAGGVRHGVVNIKGEAVWALMSFEAGVHSVKRVPATESQGRVHTSTATVAVLPEPERAEVNIDWANDVTEHITTSQGPGGQNVNKVATAVHLVHKPTGIEVRMQESKSQHQNRDKARRLLAARVYELERRRVEAERAAERKGQIGTGERSEKIRVYRYQDGIVADQRLDEKFQLREVLNGVLGPPHDALMEQETARRLAAM